MQATRRPSQVPTKIRININSVPPTNNDALNVGVITGISIGGGFVLLAVMGVIIYMWAYRKVNKSSAAKVYVANFDLEAEDAPERDVEEGEFAMYDIMDINIELSEDVGDCTNSDDNIIESKLPLDDQKDSTMNMLTVRDAGVNNDWFVMDSDDDD